MTEAKIHHMGRKIVRYLGGAEARAILGPSGSWTNGGCTVLALALQHVLGDQAEIETVASDDHPAEHSVVKVATDGGSLYVDGDGAQTKEELLFKMVELENLKNPHLVPFDMDVAVMSDHIYSEYQVEELAKDLARVIK